MTDGAGNSKLEELRARLQADPDSRLFFPLSDELRKAGQHAEAETVLRQGLAKHANYLSGWIGLGRVLSESGRPAEAIDPLEKAIALDPENVVAARLLAEAHRSTGNLLEALKRFKFVSAVLPRDEQINKSVEDLELQLKDGDSADRAIDESATSREASLQEDPFDISSPGIRDDVFGGDSSEQVPGEAEREVIASTAAESFETSPSESTVFEDDDPVVSEKPEDTPAGQNLLQDDEGEPAEVRQEADAESVPRSGGEPEEIDLSSGKTEPAEHPDSPPASQVEEAIGESFSHDVVFFSDDDAGSASFDEAKSMEAAVETASEADISYGVDEPERPAPDESSPDSSGDDLESPFDSDDDAEAIELADELLFDPPSIPLTAAREQAGFSEDLTEDLTEEVPREDATYWDAERPSESDLGSPPVNSAMPSWSDEEESMGSSSDGDPDEPPLADGVIATPTMGDLYAQQGHLDAAGEIYERVLDRDPENQLVKDKLSALRGGEGPDGQHDRRERLKGRLETWLGQISRRSKSGI